MTDQPIVYSSGGLITPGILQEAGAPAHKGEFAEGSFRSLDGDPIDGIPQLLEEGFAQFCDRFDGLEDDLTESKMDVSTVRQRWMLPLLRYLGWEPTFQARHLTPNPLDERRFAISYLGWDDPAAPPIHIVAPDGDLDERPAPRTASPHDLVQQYLNLAPQQWGIVTDGRELRILRDYHHTTAKGFIGIDLVALFASRSFEDFRALWCLAHVSRFLPSDADDADSQTILESLYERSRAAGVTVGSDLQKGVRKAIEIIASAVASQDHDVRDRLQDATRARELYGEILRVIYRLLFLFFAEQRGMLPGANTLYAETYSVTQLRDLADDPNDVDGRRTDLWEGLKVTFRLMREGSETLGVTAFDGHLFDETETPTLTAATIDNRDLLRAIGSLTTVRIEGVRQHVAYSTLGVEELGAVYESLLDFTPRIATKPQKTSTGETVGTGDLYLAQIGDRELGSYYTPSDLVAFTLEQSLDKLLDERLESAGTAHDREAALLDIRVCDPACGSGAFLVACIDRIAERLCDVRLDGAQPTEKQLSESRRDVLQHCIYGVDIDPFAVELCKVALWIHCAVEDLPLTFLDHRIQCGNSLIGWPLRDLPADIPVDAYQTKSNTKGDADTKQVCADARERNRKIIEAGQDELFGIHDVGRPDVRLDYPQLWTEDEKTPADIEKKAAAYADYLDSTVYRLWDTAADLWVASFFWTAGHGKRPPVTTDYWQARELAEKYRDGELLDEDVADHLTSPLAQAAGEIADTLNVFHWPLRFPEIAERGGFDLVTGNPPWEQFENREQDWFELKAPAIASLTGDRRKQAIKELKETNPPLWREWTFFETSNGRQAEYTRSSGRFAPSGGKPNTYMLFTETNAANARQDGRAAFIVKSSLGIDKGGQAVFGPLVRSGRVDSFYDIVNGGRGQTVVFHGVAEVERFAVLTLGPTSDNSAVGASMMNWSVEEARKRDVVKATESDLEILNPITVSLPSFRGPEQWEIALAIHDRWPTLDFDKDSRRDFGSAGAPVNGWDLEYATLFNATTASKKFHRREALEADGWRLGADMVFRRDGQGAVPLYEGQLANRYDHRAKTYAGYPVEKKYRRKPGIPATTDEDKADPDFEIEPRYWMLRETADARIDDKMGERPMIGFRDVSRPATDRRSAKAAIMPKYPATNKLPVFGIPMDHIFEFLGVFNAAVFDFLVRGKMPGASVALTWMLSQVAIPSPGLDPRIAANAKKLSLTSRSVADQFGVKPHRWDPEERYELDIETDALVAHAYGVTEKEYATILDTFDVLARAEIKAHGTFRFKDDCLAAYRRLA